MGLELLQQHLITGTSLWQSSISAVYICCPFPPHPQMKLTDSISVFILQVIIKCLNSFYIWTMIPLWIKLKCLIAIKRTKKPDFGDKWRLKVSPTSARSKWRARDTTPFNLCSVLGVIVLLLQLWWSHFTPRWEIIAGAHRGPLMLKSHWPSVLSLLPWEPQPPRWLSCSLN